LDGELILKLISLFISILLSFVVLTLILSNSIKAQEEYAQYIPGPLNGKCEACHSGSSLDAFGEQFGSTPNHISDPEGALNAISEIDSDGDGFSNSQELNLGTFPGDPNSKPKFYEVEPFPIRPIAAISISFFLFVVIIFIYNKRNFLITNTGQKENSSKNKQGLNGLRKLEHDYKNGIIEREIYLEMRKLYEETNND
jgi:hypothetical protein